MGAQQVIPKTCLRITKISSFDFSASEFDYYYCTFKKCLFYRFNRLYFAKLKKERHILIGDKAYFRFYNWDCYCGIDYELGIKELKTILKRDDIEIDLTNGFEELRT